MDVFQKSTKYKDGVRIPFKDIFQEDLKYIEDFDLSTKRAYSHQIELILHENNRLITLDTNNEILTNYMMLKHRIDHEKYKDPQDFIDDVLHYIFKSWFVEKITEYTNKQFVKYGTDVDVKLEASDKKYDDSLVFKNVHLIELYKISVAFRFIIPLVTHFMRIYSDMISISSDDDNIALVRNNIFDKNNFMSHTIVTIMNRMKSKHDNINIYGKLYNYILSVIKRTKYPDKALWDMMIVLNANEYTVAQAIMNKILVDIIPKAQFGGQLAPLIAKVAYKHNNYTLHQNFDYNYKVISPVSDNGGDDFSDVDKFEVNAAKVNEINYILQKETTTDTIIKLYNRRKYVASDEEFNFYLNNFTTNEIQKFCILHYFSSSFGGVLNIYSCNRIEWIALLLFLIKALDDAKFKYLQYFITGKVISYNEKRILNKPIERKLTESIRYANILQKYSYMADQVKKSYEIEKRLMFIFNSKMNYNHLGCDKNDNLIDIDQNAICDEFLRFVELL